MVVGSLAEPKNKPLPILEYIQQTWTTLTRVNANLATAAVDPKFRSECDGRWPVYSSYTENAQQVDETLQREMPAAALKEIDIRQLPQDLSTLREQGLLYLPKPYIVPGGRFNEMYGWDSYFIQLGLLNDNEVEMAKHLADNFLYQVKYYGKILNANRTYYLSRSQPPFLTQMVLGVYAKTKDRRWLEAALPLVEQYYKLWATAPHLVPETGLARYWDFSDGPAPEVVSAERDAKGRTHYDLVKEYFKSHQIHSYDLKQYYDAATDQLTPLFYKGDRSMRESGFDPSNRFGAFNIDAIHYNPVCLNSLLYLMEMQMPEILKELGREAESERWLKLARDRAERINRLMWDHKHGLYYDYEFRASRVRQYPFLTTFYPMWAGFATPEQAARIVKNLALFEKKGGLRTSTFDSGNQWDSPFGWAPLQMIAVEGLRRYGYDAEADRISIKWLSVVRHEYIRQGYIVEKYDVIAGGSNVSAEIHFGYSANQAGFGWTNGVFTELYKALPAQDQKRVLGH